MATIAQTRANQANAKKSTGPKSQEGKAKVAGNHITDGLFIRRHLILPGEDTAEYAALLAGATGENRTALAECEWRIRRCQRAEVAHRREKLRLLAAKQTQISPVTSKPIREPQAPPPAVTSKPIAPVSAERTQTTVVTSNPNLLSHPNTSNPNPSVTSNPIPATPMPTITYGLPPRYVQELIQLKRTQSPLDPAKDQARLSPSLRLYIKDRNHLTQARQLLKSLA